MKPLYLFVAEFLLMGCASATMAPAPKAVNWTKLPAIPEWSERVKTAKVLVDSEARRDSLFGLTEDALRGTGISLFLAGTSSPTAIRPEDFKPVPALNFDVRLNQKSSMKFTATTKTRSLKNDAGYYFTSGGIPYVVLGPYSIDVRDPDLLRMYAEHELYHAHHHVGDRRPLTDRELETWTMQFRHWFFKIRQYRQRWVPLIAYYERASTDAQQRALARLEEYYRNPPADRVPSTEVATEQRAFLAWLDRRIHDAHTNSSKLIQALQRDLQPSIPQTS
jgi:hypothetical protein